MGICRNSTISDAEMDIEKEICYRKRNHYHLSQTIVGLLSAVYLTGTYSATKAGALTNKHGRGKVLLGRSCDCQWMGRSTS
ncbi:hypothetical protein XCR1_160019 [Xenorhabdus cabanillasii JM26]|uniref:Uncharacterized protein n=1 Tax=Xenorhabdus cabanillasii JM26 TaxID=1427517 RepID=W1IWM0_9GAMM|nr:membrane protein [Xenorhabdus cabanillasii JM26]CDL81615.1 hypothetical protein XCR1_160019 [Xenorhabdus cabanillasii JM26]